MKTRIPFRVLAVTLAISCGVATAPVYAADESAPKPAGEQKFILETLTAVSSVITIYGALSDWFNNRNSPGSAPPVAYQPAPVQFAAAQPGNVSNVQPPWANSAPQATAGRPSGASPYYVSTPIILGQPDIPFNPGVSGGPGKEWGVGANYQGVQVSAVILNQTNQPVEIRPLNAPFRSGERFKLRLVSTFEALASVDAYRTMAAAPGTMATQAWAGQLYPPKADQVVKMRAGEMVQLPLSPAEYFTFDNQAGLDRLMLNVRHPQASGIQSNGQPVYRQDSAQGSTYMQLTPQGSYPALSQLLAFQHNQ